MDSPQLPPQDSLQPTISVIVPVRNEAASLPALLRALAAQQYPADRFEIVVADGRSTDRTRDVVLAVAAQSLVPIRLVDNPGIRSGPGRNAGVLRSTGELVVFIDGHCELPSARLLADTAGLFAETGADCLCRPQPLLARQGHSSMGAAVAAARASWLGHGRDSHIYDLGFRGFVDPASSGASYRRAVFARVGLYDERFDACEDVEFNTRVRLAGLRAYTDPRLAVLYEPRTSLRALWRQMVRYGRGRARLMRVHPETRSAGAVAPLLLLLATVAALPLAMLAPVLGALAFCPGALFLLAVAVCSAGLGRRHGLPVFWRAPAVFAVIYAGLGAGLLAGGVAGLLGRRRAEAAYSVPPMG